MGFANTSLRIGLGTIMAGHGLQKVAGKFGGSGLDGTAQGFEKMGFHPGKPYATAAGLAETVGGGLLAAGMWTPLGAAMVTGVMGTAINKVHAKNGVWVTNGGFEYNALIIAAAFAVTEHGPGFPAVDGLLTKRRKGFGWALAELALGLGGAAAVIALTSRGQDLADEVGAVAAQPATVVSDTTQRVANGVASAADAVAQKARTASDAVGDAADRAAGTVAAGADHVSQEAGAAAGETTNNGGS